MIKTTSSLGLISLALFASMCHQTFSSEVSTSPITVPSRHEQCLSHGMHGACDFTDTDGVTHYSSCRNLICAQLLNHESWSAPSYKRRFVGAVKDGTYCGPSSYCFRTKCVHSEEGSKRYKYTSSETKIAECN